MLLLSESKIRKRLPSPKKRKAFTIIEILITVPIFALAMFVAVKIFSEAFLFGNDSVTIQRNAENLQFAIEQMSKELRMSLVQEFDFDDYSKRFVIDPGGKKITFYSEYDAINPQCISFLFDEASDRIKRSQKSVAAPSDCVSDGGIPSPSPDYADLTPNAADMEIIGQFIEKSEPGVPPGEEHEHFVLILIEARMGKMSGGTSAGRMRIETGVSVRNIELII